MKEPKWTWSSARRESWYRANPVPPYVENDRESRLAIARIPRCRADRGELYVPPREWRTNPPEGMIPARREKPPPIPTLGQLRETGCWVWLCCAMCPHRTPIAYAPFLIRCGPNASSDVLRRAGRCAVCGHKGAVFQTTHREEPWPDGTKKPVGWDSARGWI